MQPMVTAWERRVDFLSLANKEVREDKVVPFAAGGHEEQEGGKEMRRPQGSQLP